jgi:hypothetical protein
MKVMHITASAKFSIITTALLAFAGGLALCQIPDRFGDVPVSDPGYLSVSTLKRYKFVNSFVYDGHKVKGVTIMTRYEFAVITKRSNDTLNASKPHFAHERDIRKAVAQLNKEFAREVAQLERDSKKRAGENSKSQ